MTPLIITAIPPGHFEEINAYLPDWQETALALVQEKKRIKYDGHNVTDLPKKIYTKLDENNYRWLWFEEQDLFFLIPKYS